MIAIIFHVIEDSPFSFYPLFILLAWSLRKFLSHLDPCDSHSIHMIMIMAMMANKFRMPRKFKKIILNEIYCLKNGTVGID